MQLTLKLRFHTYFGQSLFVTGNHPLFGDGELERAIPLAYVDNEYWQVTITFPHGTGLSPAGIVYNYLLREADGTTTLDWGDERVLTVDTLSVSEVLIVDSWNPAGAPENAFYTEPFQAVLLKDRQAACNAAPHARPTHEFRVKAPLLAHDQALCLLGSGNALGEWETQQPILLNRTPGDVFLRGSISLEGEAFPLEYKYGVYDVERQFLVAYEAGENRRLTTPQGPSRKVIINDGFARLPADTWRGAGVAIPVFSLRSEQSFGVGEFSDLKPLAAWCQRVGLKLIQILPVNDTTSTHTWLDSYPYSAISAFALNPVYLNLADVATEANKARLKKLEPERRRLNALPVIDYAAVMKAKLQWLKEIFPTEREETFQSRSYQEFFAENRHWLAPFAVFCFLRDQHGTADSRQWPANTRCTPELVAQLSAPESPTFADVAFHCFLQYHLHRQLQDAADYAHERGVILKGDIAIGVSRDGADTWQQPELYDLSVQAGAPPDPFSDKGQNWGFPTYNWPRMMEDGFRWWKRRFGQMSHYFDAFRVDHILGFFRIWSIPAHAVEGLLGYFVPAIPISTEELTERGINFNRERFLKPFITEAVLHEIFGHDAEVVQERYVKPAGIGSYRLRDECDTQRKVEAHFSALKDSDANQKLKLGLFDLISNVLFVKAENSNGNEFHCRFFMEKTSSFRALDAETQAKLRELYVDYFFRRQDGFWMRQALQKLPTLKRVTNMLICGEDLGLVPACVPDVMKGLGLLSLEIQRMPKNPSQTFSRPSEAPYLSVVTPSTHDMSTLRGWWTEDAGLRQRFYNEELGQPGVAPAECSGALNQMMVEQHLAAPAMWSIFQLQDLLGMDESLRHPDAQAERINIPANPKHYWRYRMHLTLESLQQAARFNEHLRALVQKHGREV
jgi:4-alpha-glucanotransferase